MSAAMACADFSFLLSPLDYLHSVIKEVSEAEERGLSVDDIGMGTIPRAGGSSDDLEGDGIITFTARKPSSKLIVLLS